MTFGAGVGNFLTVAVNNQFKKERLLMADESGTRIGRLDDLVGVDLSGFKVVRMFEACSVNEDGTRVRSLGFFVNKDVATVFAANTKTGESGTRVSLALVLTDGQVSFVLSNQEPAQIPDEAQERLRLREVVLDKLTSSERALLGLVPPVRTAELKE